MARNFRNSSPKRKCKRTYRNYRSYKPYLSEDFNGKCGYTDCSHFWFGGSNMFHIDHFKPYSKYPELKANYSNLVYCCSYVNILKSDDEGDYLDPCDVDLNTHFERTDNGTIVPKSNSKEATYMFKKLQLGLARYQIIWMLDEMLVKMDMLTQKINNTKDDSLKIKLRVTHSELSEELSKYIKYLKASQ